MIDELEIKKLWGDTHPAIKYDFDYLIDGIEENVDLGYINKQEDNLGLTLYNYSSSATYEQHWNLFTLISRGLIVDKSNKKIAALPMMKFFNYGEVGIMGAGESGDIVATDKMDGSCISIYYHPYLNKWKCATRGSFNSDQAQWAENWLYANVDMTRMDGVIRTYICEVIYSENKIVIDYDFEGLVLLTGYYANGEEMGHDTAINLANHMNMRVTKQKLFANIDELLEEAKILDHQHEGWVLRFANGHRIKVKGDEYCRVHAIISNCTPLAVWRMLQAGDDIEAYRTDLPEEFRKNFDNMVKILLEQAENIKNMHYKAYEDTRHLSDKELGISKEYKDIKAKAFAIRSAIKKNLDWFIDVAMASEASRNAFWRQIRPDGNILEGYEPSSVVERFEE